MWHAIQKWRLQRCLADNLCGTSGPAGTIFGLWHAFGESSSVREKKSFGQSSQRDGCSSNMASLERLLELMGLKSQEEVGSGSNIAPPLKGAKAHTASLCATRSSSGHEVWLEGM
jgi:hypothetical protein